MTLTSRASRALAQADRVVAADLPGAFARRPTSQLFFTRVRMARAQAVSEKDAD
jgi:hypothetical protein